MYRICHRTHTAYDTTEDVSGQVGNGRFHMGAHMSESENLARDGALTIDQASEFCGVGRSLLYERMQSGSLAYSLIGRRRVIPRQALVKLIAAGVVGGQVVVK